MLPFSSTVIQARVVGSMWSSMSSASSGAARIFGLAGFADHMPPSTIVVIVAVVVGDADEVEHREDGLLRPCGCRARASAGTGWRSGEAREHQVHHLGAVEAGVEHVHRHQDLRERFLLEALDLGHAVDWCRPAPVCPETT
jgi:hypothetical protein